MKQGSLVSLFSFENEDLVFPAVHHATKFCLLTLSGAARHVAKADFVFFARQAEDLSDIHRHFQLSIEDLELLNPNTQTCLVFRSAKDAELSKALYRRVPVLMDERKRTNTWEATLLRMFHMGDDAELFRTDDQLRQEGFTLEGNVFRRGGIVFLPLYEAKMVNQFDHRFGTYAGQTEAQANQGKLPELTAAQHLDPHHAALPRYWVAETHVISFFQDKWSRSWLLGWRNITSAVTTRTSIATVIPRSAVGDPYPLILLSNDLAPRAGLLQANLSSFVFDYCARQTIGGNHLTYTSLAQLPLLPPSAYVGTAPWDERQPANSIADWIAARSLELTYTAWDLQPFAMDCGYAGSPFVWDEDRRFQIRCELDAAFFNFYGVARNDVGYIMDTFPIVKRKDEQNFNGDYRTKRVILEVYDAMAEATKTGKAYQTRLNPPPADPRAAHRIGHEDKPVIGSERVWLVILLLVRAWKQKGLAVGRPALETGLLLMFNDELRKNLLGIPAMSKVAIATTASASSLVGLDFFIAEGAKRNWLRVTQSEFQQTIEVGDAFPGNLDIPVDDLTRAAETMTVIDRLAKREVELPAKVQRVELSTKSLSTASAAGTR